MKNRLIQIDDISIDESMLKNNTLVDALCRLISCKRLARKNSEMLSEFCSKSEKSSSDLSL